MKGKSFDSSIGVRAAQLRTNSSTTSYGAFSCLLIYVYNRLNVTHTIKVMENLVNEIFLYSA